MKKKIYCSVVCLVLILLLTGCWDRNEINDYAFWIGSAEDLTDSGKLEKSAQISIPAEMNTPKGGGGKEQRANIVITATGSSILDLMQKIQDKVPRKVFLGHRRAIFIGEKMARKGLTDIMDQFLRDTDTRMRTDIFVVDNGKGKDVLTIKSPFNPFSAIVAVDQDRFSRIGDTALRDVLLDVGRDGIRPVMPMIKISPKNKQEKNETFEVRSVAVFNKNLQMVGKVSERESLELFWIKGTLKNRFVTEETGQGSVSMYESHLKKSIRTEFKNNKLITHLKLMGTARVLENNTDIDLSVSAERIRLERKFNEIKKRQVEATLKKIQHKYGQDVFGFGEEIHREHPYYWKKIRNQWDQIFPKLEVSVDVKLKIQNTGDLGKRIPGIGVGK